MTYTVTETVEDSQDEQTRSLSQNVTLDKPHVAVDFDAQGFTEVTKLRFETGWVMLPGDLKVEVTRLIMTCTEGHNHGIYYQAPREMELWEAMFAIGETNVVPS